MLLASTIMFSPIRESLEHISDRRNRWEVRLNGRLRSNTASTVILGKNIMLR